MTKEYTETLTEVSEILNNMEEKDINKIPKSIINYINKNKSNEYNFKIVPGIPFEEQKIKRETLALLAMFSLNYWCESEEEKRELYNKFAENERIEEEEKRKKYNPEDLFKIKKNDKEQITNNKSTKEKEQQIDESKKIKQQIIENKSTQEAENTELIEYKEPNFLMKIIFKLKKIFGKNNN